MQTLIVRWIIASDLETIADIEFESFDNPESMNELRKTLREINHCGMVMEENEKIVAYVVYHVTEKEIDILSFAVAHEYRRKGYGTRLIQHMKRKGRKLFFAIKEDNLLAQVFLRSQGFRVVRNLEKGYLMKWVS